MKKKEMRMMVTMEGKGKGNGEVCVSRKLVSFQAYKRYRCRDVEVFYCSYAYISCLPPSMCAHDNWKVKRP